ncbi:MAG: ComF family protein [Vagococcus sp.]
MKCVMCQTEISRELSLSQLIGHSKLSKTTCCKPCLQTFHKIDLTDELRCQTCCKVIESKGECEDCDRWAKSLPTITLKHTSLFDYNEAMQRYFKQYKFDGDYRLCQMFSDEMKHAIEAIPDVIVVPIPLSKEREKERGFNQVEAMLQASGIDFVPALKKRIDSQKQSEKNKDERLVSKQPFELRTKSIKKVKNNHVLLVDDVYTTGRTMLHGYDCLLKAQPKGIQSFSLTR